MNDRLPHIGPQRFAQIATLSFGLLVAIVFSGAAVRLTGSGLGCPTWPDCNGHLVTTELDFHGAVEHINRLITGVVGVGAIAAALLAFLRTPFRRDLAILGLMLPLGVVVQILLGAAVVIYGLAPGWVMGHFLTSLSIIAAAFALMWRARMPDDEQSEPTEDRRTVLATRALLPIAAWVLLLGTIATGAGPHPGTHGDEVATRFAFRGGDTMDWMIHWHGRFSTLFGLCTLGLWFSLRKVGASPGLRRAVTAVCLLVAAQGVVGFIQYENELPAGIVWVHVCLATMTWIAVLWSVAAAGRLSRSAQPAEQPKQPEPLTT